MTNKLPKMIFILGSLGILFVASWKMSNWSKENRNLSIVINEVCSDSFSTAPLRWRENMDWIELYNASEEAISLEGWTISDDKDDMTKFILPDFVIEPGTFRVIYATGENRITETNVFLNFRLSAGESLYLCNNKKELVDSVAIPTIRQDTSYARITDAGIDWANVVPTPNLSNNNMQYVQTVSVQGPRFSLESGFYDGVQMLELSGSKDVDIYYTMDGSEPTGDSILYSEPILIENRTKEKNVLSARTDISIEECYRYAPQEPVDKITVVRAIAIDKDGNKSDIITRSYVIDIQNNPTYQGLLTVSLTTDPSYLFDKENGKYILGSAYEVFAQENGYILEDGQVKPNYWKEGRTSEMPGYVEVFDREGNLLLNQDIGLRVRGNATRNLSQKSFSVFAREKYSGTDVFDSDVFGNGHKYHRLILMTDRDVPKVRHELHGELLEDRAVETQQFMRCNVFLDGEYWGVYSLSEVYSEEFVENHYKIPQEEVIFSDSLYPDELVQLCENEAGLSETELYESLVAKIDLDSFMDYYASMLYIDNYDWLPHNGYMWKSATISAQNPYQDGKWRWMVYDTEWSEEYADRNTFAEGMVTTWQTDPIVQILMTSEEFRQKFTTVFMDLANTTFEKEHVISTMDSVFASYSQAVEAQGIRWGDDWADEVYLDLDKIRDFFMNRFNYITGYLKEELGLEGELVEVQIANSDASKGSVHVNTVTPQLNNGSWSGYYFTDYSVTLSVTENEEGSFAGWYDKEQNLISGKTEITVDLNKENYFQAVFK